MPALLQLHPDRQYDREPDGHHHADHGLHRQGKLELELSDNMANNTGGVDYEQFTLEVAPGSITQNGSTLTVTGTSTPGTSRSTLTRVSAWSGW